MNVISTMTKVTYKPCILLSATTPDVRELGPWNLWFTRQQNVFELLQVASSRICWITNLRMVLYKVMKRYLFIYSFIRPYGLKRKYNS